MKYHALHCRNRQYRTDSYNWALTKLLSHPSFPPLLNHTFWNHYRFAWRARRRVVLCWKYLLCNCNSLETTPPSYIHLCSKKCVLPYENWEPASSDWHWGWQFSSRAALLSACIHSNWASIITLDYWDEDRESITPLSHNEFNISQDNEHLTNCWSYKWCNTVHKSWTY